MSKSKLLILDTNVVIFLMTRGIWEKLIEVCEVHLSQTIVDETAFYDDDDGNRHYIDLSNDISKAKILVFEVALHDINSFLDQFDPIYTDQLDPGELEALAFLCSSKENYRICSGDAIVYRVLGRLNRADQGISLEELLPSIGLKQPNLPYSQSKSFRDLHSNNGFKDSLTGTGLRKKKPGKK